MSAEGRAAGSASDGAGSLAIRAAAILYVILGAGFWAGGAVTLAHLARVGELPLTPFGFRSMSGPFEQLGQDAFVVLGWSFVGVCALEVLAGILLWQRRRLGGWLGLATTPFALALGLGFALPIALVAAPLRAALILAGKRCLR